MIERIRLVIDKHAQLSKKSDTLLESASLYDAGMTSFASVRMMLALEDEFGIEFPDHMLKREVFESVNSICDAINRILAGEP